MKPSCYNRPDYGNYLLQDGWEDVVLQDGRRSRIPIMVERPFTMSQGCKCWASDKASDPVPMMEGWDCEGCRHYPFEDVDAAIANRAARDARPKTSG